QHPFDYCNVANNWMRNSDNPYQARVLYLMANFINDVAHENKLQEPVIDKEFAEYNFAGKLPEALLRELDDAIMALDFPRSPAARRSGFIINAATLACVLRDALRRSPGALLSMRVDY